MWTSSHWYVPNLCCPIFFVARVKNNGSGPWGAFCCGAGQAPVQDREMEVILSRLPGSLPVLRHRPLARAAPRDSLTSRQVRQSTVLLEQPQNSLRPTGVKALLSTPKGPRNNTQPPKTWAHASSAVPHTTAQTWGHPRCPWTGDGCMQGVQARAGIVPSLKKKGPPDTWCTVGGPRGHAAQ